MILHLTKKYKETEIANKCTKFKHRSVSEAYVVLATPPVASIPLSFSPCKYQKDHKEYIRRVRLGEMKSFLIYRRFLIEMMGFKQGLEESRQWTA